ncbi:conserved hypothetical protein [Anaeromyxobacter dehalogenans 2CP-1]|uniref:Abortive infection protein-like C-terminal domain-containing protein n=1 Tax=Anaeromyxobacter dehalogenans (strain ATCC BAA-258 / DSM 21875 / 2CP-1) TaxID=455488 RepID=B8JFN6_ANAD2|nr:hypothetical protein [Anaeromyxobacter dehalogenans]ACL64474.1 conserved hypothetical protein [Anaeromyxobacter dehalogenans 2CP-1]
MALLDRISRRRKPPQPLVKHDQIPPAFRLQAQMILQDALGRDEYGRQQRLIEELGRMLYREIPTPSFELQRVGSWIRGNITAPDVLYQYVAVGNTDECLDAIELGFRAINGEMRERWNKSQHDRKSYLHWHGAKLTPDEATEELNVRFADHGLGYRFSVEAHQLIRSDSQYMQQEVVELAWRLLHELGFDGPAEEFAHAHRCFRRGGAKDLEDAITNAAKAVESTAKAICAQRRWKHDRGATLKPLLKLLFDKGLVPTRLDSFFAGLRTALESGLPPIRNSQGGHGQGAKPREIDDHVVELALNLGASSIVFLCQAHRAMK